MRVPARAPYLAAGLRTGVTLSLVGAVVAEWTGTDRGLGYLVLSANARLATAQAFAAVLVITCLGLLAYGAVVLLERRLCWWTPGAGRVRPSAPPDSTPAKGPHELAVSPRRDLHRPPRRLRRCGAAHACWPPRARGARARRLRRRAAGGGGDRPPPAAAATAAAPRSPRSR